MNQGLVYGMQLPNIVTTGYASFGQYGAPCSAHAQVYYVFTVEMDGMSVYWQTRDQSAKR